MAETTTNEVIFDGVPYRGTSYITHAGDTVKEYSTDIARPGQLYQVKLVRKKGNNGNTTILTQQETGNVKAGRTFRVNETSDWGKTLTDAFGPSAKELSPHSDYSQLPAWKRFLYGLIGLQDGGKVVRDQESAWPLQPLKSHHYLTKENDPNRLDWNNYNQWENTWNDLGFPDSDHQQLGHAMGKTIYLLDYLKRHPEIKNVDGQSLYKGVAENYPLARDIYETQSKKYFNAPARFSGNLPLSVEKVHATDVLNKLRPDPSKLWVRPRPEYIESEKCGGKVKKKQEGGAVTGEFPPTWNQGEIRQGFQKARPEWLQKFGDWAAEKSGEYNNPKKVGPLSVIFGPVFDYVTGQSDPETGYAAILPAGKAVKVANAAKKAALKESALLNKEIERAFQERGLRESMKKWDAEILTNADRNVIKNKVTPNWLDEFKVDNTSRINELDLNNLIKGSQEPSWLGGLMIGSGLGTVGGGMYLLNKEHQKKKADQKPKDATKKNDDKK